MAEKQEKLHPISLVIRLASIAFVAWIIAVAVLIVAIHTTGTVDNAQEADAILVLGSGLSRDGRPGYALTRRSSRAAQLWQAGFADTIICTGGIADNQTRSEADGCREVLTRRGVPASAILLEESSASTEENALFSAPIIAENGIDSIIIVSDSYHVFRADYIFNRVDIETYLSPVSSDMIRGRPTYEYSVVREVLALHWQVFKDVFNIPITNIQ